MPLGMRKGIHGRKKMPPPDPKTVSDLIREGRSPLVA